MKPELQRIAIAEACGWIKTDTPKLSTWGFRFSGKEWCYPYQLPDFLNDLNAMHEAESALGLNRCDEFERHLKEIVDMHGFRPTFVADYFAFHATAAQRAEAFLKTIGKWTKDYALNPSKSASEAGSQTKE